MAIKIISLNSHSFIDCCWQKPNSTEKLLKVWERLKMASTSNLYLYRLYNIHGSAFIKAVIKSKYQSTVIRKFSYTQNIIKRSITLNNNNKIQTEEDKKINKIIIISKV